MPDYLDQKIRQVTFIKAPPQEVYNAISTADGWNSFFTTGLEVDPQPGGRMIWRWKDWGPLFYNVEADARVVAADPPTRFAFQWYPVGKDFPTTITFNLKDSYGGTIVELTEEGYIDTPKGRDMIIECACGWGEALTLLKFYLEHGLTYTQPEKELEGSK